MTPTFQYRCWWTGKVYEVSGLHPEPYDARDTYLRTV